MANSRNDPSRKRFGSSDGDRPRADHVSSGTGFYSDTVEKTRPQSRGVKDHGAAGIAEANRDEQDDSKTVGGRRRELREV